MLEFNLRRKTFIDKKKARMAIINTALIGRFSSDRTIMEYSKNLETQSYQCGNLIIAI